MPSEEWELANKALDGEAKLEERIAAIEGLGRSGSHGAVSPLLELGERQGEPAEILRAAGSALAALVHRGAAISEFDMRDLKEMAYNAFCEWEP